VLMTRLAERTRSNIVEQLVRLETHEEKLQPIAIDRSAKAARRLSACIDLPCGCETSLLR